MKFKLGALLMFSQVAQAVGAAVRGTPEWYADQEYVAHWKAGITETNYKEQICGPDLFVDPENRLGNPVDKSGATKKITTTYDAYCYSKSKYEQEIENKKNGHGTPLDDDIKITKNGITLATACKHLKQIKKSDLGIWLHIFHNPKPCTPAPSNYVRPKKSKEPTGAPSHSPTPYTRPR